MNNEKINNGDPKPQRNKWSLILGILFLGYGSFRLYQKLQTSEPDTFGILLAIGFIAFGIYDLWKYYKGV